MSRPPDTFLTRRTYPDGREEIDVGRHDRAHIAVDRRPSTLEIRIRFSPAPTSESQCTGLALRICPESAPLMAVTGVASPTWHMAAGLLPRRSRDVFSQLMCTTYDEVVRGSSLPYEAQLDMPLYYQSRRRNPDSCRSGFSRSVVSSMRIIAAVLREAAIYSAQLCDPGLLRIVRRFSPCMRPWLYQTIAADPSRRLAQLASSCPGALVFAFASQEHDVTRTVGTRLLEGAIAGRRLNRLLTEAVSHWSAAVSDWDIEQEPRLARPWLRILDAGSAERRRLEADQRLLIRRAGPRTSPTYVLLPPPLALAPEDVPASVRENARWFRTMKARVDLVSPHADQNEDLLRQLARFASRHFRVLHPARGKEMIGRRMGQVIDYVLASERHTSRQTCPERLLAECKQWHRTVYENLELCHLQGRDPVTPETELPVADADSWSDGRVVAARIRTVGELIREGKKMRSCVGTRAKAALQGRCSIYSVEVDGKPITVEITHMPNGRSFVSEMAGFANRAIPPEEFQAIEPWLTEIGARH